MKQSEKAAVSEAGIGQTIDIIGRLRDRATKGKGAEKRLVECILADPQFAANAPLAEIAGRANVSEPTITRLARATGLSGTREFRFHLAQALALVGAYIRSSNAEVEDASAAGGWAAHVVSGAHSAIDRMMLGVREQDLTSVAHRLSRARRILICGTGGGSSMAAVELENRLFRLGLNVSARTDPQLQRMNASVLGDGDVVVGFSLSGQVTSVLNAMQIAGQYGAYSVAVTSPDTPISRAANIVLPLDIEEDGDLYKPTSARYGLLSLVDALSLATAHAIGPEVLETLRRIRQSLATQNIRDPNMPLGD